MSKAAVWEEYNRELSELLSNMNEVEKAPTEMATRSNTLLSTFLESKSEVRKKNVNIFYKHDPKLTKNLNEAKKLKQKLEKIARQPDSTHEDKSRSCEALRHYNYILKEKKIKEESIEIKKQEKDYKKNFHKFAKETTNGT